MFSSIILSFCPSVCLSVSRIFQKACGINFHELFGTRNNKLDSWHDLDKDPNQESFLDVHGHLLQPRFMDIQYIRCIS